MRRGPHSNLVEIRQTWSLRRGCPFFPHTLLPDTKQLIGFPRHHPPGQPAPTPLHDPAKHLPMLAVRLHRLGMHRTHRRLGQEQFLAETVPMQWIASIGVEVVANETPSCHRIGRRSKR